jgi:L-malate glycosyltransferase
MEVNDKDFSDTSGVALTVLMPVYNGERFLKSAIESILSQSFSDFEFLIINDGSTDNSDTIIRSFNDKRITLVSNEKNLGLISSLNKGINLAKGKYIARMDGDDISLPERLSKQIGFLELHPEVSLVATNIQLVDEGENDLGMWAEDVRTKTEKEIRSLLPYTNCIAHPSIVIRTPVAKKFLYDERQINNEDWDLWMRLASAGHKLAKINEPLLKYRLHTNSITFQSNQKNVSKKLLSTQKNYFFKKALNLRINFFDLKVLGGLLLNVAEAYTGGIFSRFKRSIYKFFTVKIPKKINRLKMLIRFAKTMSTSKNDSGLFFFFPYYHVGGAERVHIDILRTVVDKNPWIFFTNESENDAFYSEFSKYGKAFDLSSFSSKYKWVTKKIISNKINKTNNALTFGCNSNFFYQLIPKLDKRIECIDLIHAFAHKHENAAEHWSLPLAARLNKRVFISKRSIEDLKEQYLENKIPGYLIDNIIYIPNQVKIPKGYPERKKKERIKIIYVGRGTQEKRVNIIGKVAKACSGLALGVDFLMVGNNKYGVEPQYQQYLKFYGEVTDSLVMEKIYMESDLILITSSREGFPMVIMEAMSYGCIPLSTDVGDISLHINNGTNGFVVPNDFDEELITKSFVSLIEKIYRNEFELIKLSQNAYEYAKNNFSSESFYKKYRTILLKETK